MANELDSMLGIHEEQGAFSEDEAIWNLFVQLLLPLILLLTFISVIDIERYKYRAMVINEENKDLKDNMGRILSAYDPEGLHMTSQNWLIEAQRQKLLNALSVIRQEEEKWFRFGRVETASDIEVSGTSIVDEDFRLLSTRISDKLEGNNRRKYMVNIYRRVLDEAELQDRTGMRFTRRKVEDELITESELYKAKSSNISRANVAYIHNRIIEFSDSLLNYTTDLQTAVLEKIFDELLVHPESLDEGTRKDIRLLMSEVNEDERQRLLNRIYREITSMVRDDMKEYGFLSETLQQISSME